MLAQRADERWRSKPSLMDRPRRENLELGVGDGERQVTTTVGRTDLTQRETRGEVEGGDAGGEGGGQQRERAENPWKNTKPRRAGEDWQPESWQPPAGLGR